MRYVRLFTIIFVTTAGAFAQIQDLPRGEIFGGYSYTSASVGSGTHYNLQGFVFSGDHNLKPWLAIAYKEDAYWGSVAIPFCYSSSPGSCVVVGPHDTAHLDTVLGGLRLATTRDRLTPFARALFGVCFMFACVQPGCESKAGYSQEFTGGVQVRVTERRLGWRVEGGLLQTHLFGSWQNDFRLSTGPVILLYGRK
jgi:hypothetical protein